MDILDPVSITDALAQVTEHWTPHVVGQVNDQYVKVAKLLGEFVWHAHDGEDELFLVVSGSLTLQLRDRDVILGPNDVFVVPRGVEHCPLAVEEASVVMIELKGTVNTGDAGGDRSHRPAGAGWSTGCSRPGPTRSWSTCSSGAGTRRLDAFCPPLPRSAILGTARPPRRQWGARALGVWGNWQPD